MEAKTYSIEDTVFLNQIRQGDKRSLEKIFEKYYIKLCRYALKFSGRRDISEEIVQELFIDLWRKREELPEIMIVSSYLFSAVRNRSLNYLKSPASRFQEFDTVNLDQGLETTEEYMNVSELELIVAKAIEKLPQKCRTIFILSRQEGLTYKMIAEHLDISIKTVETQMAIALKRVKDHVEDNWGKILFLLFSLLIYILIFF